MHKFNGVSVPAIKPKDNTDLGRQETICRTTVAEECGPLDCCECLFYRANIKTFLKWESLRRDF